MVVTEVTRERVSRSLSTTKKKGLDLILMIKHRIRNMKTISA